MNRYLLVLYLTLLMLVALPANGCDAEQQCIETGQWDIGIALGVGARSNPLVGGDTFPNIVLVDIAWYGEDLYFDNGELGYRLVQQANFGVEGFVTIDREKAFFDLWHTSNVVLSSMVPLPGPPPTSDDPVTDAPGSEEISIDEISHRKWAVNAGLRGHYYGDHDEWTWSFETDVSSVHQGHKMVLSYERFWSNDDWRLSIRPSLVWKSDNLLNYYYGISEQDSWNSSFHYQAKGGLQPGVAVIYSQAINQDWTWLAHGSYRHLNSGMTDSPIVAKDNVFSVFFGAGYRF